MTEVKIVSTAQAVVDPDGNKLFILKRGEQVNLTRLDPTLKRIMVGVGWDVIGFDSEAPDLDVSLFLLDKNDQTRMDEDFVFYNNLKSLEGSAEHMGDNRTGAGDGDDENALIDLMGLPFEIMKIAFVVSIYDAAMRDQSFKSVRNCFLRIVNQETGIELMRFNLDHEFEENPKATAVTVGILERAGPDWMFIGTGHLDDGGLPKIATSYGIVVAM
jgi:tellurium resistance protein TerD